MTDEVFTFSDTPYVDSHFARFCHTTYAVYTANHGPITQQGSATHSPSGSRYARALRLICATLHRPVLSHRCSNT